MPHILSPSLFHKRNGVAQISDMLCIVSWCCGTTIDQVFSDYRCAICGRQIETTDGKPPGFWITKVQMLAGHEGPEFGDWISAWTGIPEDQLTCEIEHE